MIGAMSAKHALLGLLLDRPAYPYQLSTRLAQRLGPTWRVNSGQLYQTVKALERDGLIERVQDASPEQQERHVFSITDAGVLEFERFFAQGSEAVRLSRRPLLLKITFAGPQQLQETLAKLDAYEAHCAELLAQTARLREELPIEGPLVRADQLLLRLNLSADVFQLEGELRWARHAREMLSWLSSRQAVWPSARERSEPEAPGTGRERAQGTGRERPESQAQGTGRERASARRELFSRIAGSE